MITIRACTPEDLSDLLAISYNTYNETFAHLNSPSNMNAYLEKSFNQKQLQNELANPASIELERIYVKKEFQGRRLGQILMAKTIEIAKAREKSYIWLGVWEKNKNALDFYQKGGFYETCKHSFIMGDEVQNDYILRKDII